MSSRLAKRARLDLDWRDHVDTDKTLFRPSESQRVVLDPSHVRDRLGWVAHSKLNDVVDHLVKCALNDTLGPMPWLGSPLPDLGSGLIDQSQKMTVAAMQMADMNVCAQRS
jgi:hypothetical protein